MIYQAGLSLDRLREHPRQLLPMDGSCQYFGKILTPQEAFSFLQALLTQIAWEPDRVFIFGKHNVTARKVAWFGDAKLSYAYSGTNHNHPLPWTNELLAIKGRVEEITKVKFNACLANFYQDGSQGMGWHQDNEKELDQLNIASISLGAERRFDFRHICSGEKQSVFLEQGSLILMKDDTQRHWQHQLPKSAKVTAPRINLTFRNIINLDATTS